MKLATLHALAAGTLLVAAAVPAHALTIVPTYDSSVTSLGWAGNFEHAFNEAAASFSAMFSNPVTVNINVSFGKVAGQAMPSGALGESSTALYGYFNYGQMASWLKASATTAADASAYASLPATAAIPSTTNFVLTSAQAKALGLVSPTTGIDGSIGIGNNSYFDRGTTAAVKGAYDLVGVAQHELSEVLGRISGINAPTPSYETAYDLFRFNGTGSRTTGYSSRAYFSVNNGVTDLANFNVSSMGGDRGDWESSSVTTDSADAFTYPGVVNGFSGMDQTALDVVGWGGTGTGTMSGVHVINQPGLTATVPEPASLAVLGAGVAGMLGLRRRRAG